MKYNSIKVILVMFLLCSGCKTMQQEKELQFNSVVSDQHVIEVLSSRPIKLVAPASGTHPEKIEKLKTLPFIDVPDNLIEDGYIYHANSDEERLRILKDALFNGPANSVVWTLRGGYGSARLIEALKKTPKPKHKKTFIGYSDITALHLFLAQEWQWHPIHGAGLEELLKPEKDPQNIQKIINILSGAKTTTIEHLTPFNSLAQNTRKISGPITGGNLTLIQNSLGTPWQIRTQGMILFLEDHQEKGYQLDRSLNQLKQAGIFKEVKAIVLGDIDNVEESIDFALKRFAMNINIPVFKTNQFGHGKINHPIIYHANSLILPNGESNEENQEYHLIMNLK